MKRKFFTVFLALVLVLSFSVVTAVPVAAQTDWYVDDSATGANDGTSWTDAFTTIGAAITAASSGDTINVAAGTYNENVDVDKSLTLTGASSATVTVGAAGEDNVFDVTASSVTISGFTVNGANVEIYPHPVVEGFEIAGYAGIYLKPGVTDCNIHDNTLTGNVYGILLLEAEDTVIPGNNTFTSNTATNNVISGIEMQHTYGNTFTSNIASSNGKYGITLDSSRNNIFTGNTANSNSREGFWLKQGQGIVGSSGNTFTNNTANLNTWCGIHMTNLSGDTTYTGNTFDSNVIAGMKLGGTVGDAISNLTVNNNSFSGNPTGILIDAGAIITSVALRNNDIVGNTNFGVSNAGTGTLDAEDNWWGSAVGPAHSTNVVFNTGTARGNAVSDDVDYVPWCDTDKTGTSFAPVTVGTGTTYHTSIQAGIDAASAGDTITCATGTFDEDLLVNTASLTLRSTAGSTTITTTTKPGIEIQSGATNFVLGGASGQGFTIDGTAAHLIVLANNPSGVEISYNTIDHINVSVTRGISVGVAGATNLNVSNNTFTGASGDGSFSAWDGPTSNVTVSGNTFQTGAYAIQFSGVTGTSTISNNTISGYSGAGAIVITNGTGTSGLTISGNTVTSCSYGVRFEEECLYGTNGNVTTVTITYNSISGSTSDAIKIADSTYILASNFTINYNAFINSTGYGLENLSTEQVAAEWNCWGRAAGPQHCSNPYIQWAERQENDIVSNNVDYIPWMISKKLAADWNLWSTPIAPDTATDTLGEALDIFGVDSTQFSPEDLIGYYFDGEEQGWGEVTLGMRLTPLQALYLNTSANTTIDVCFSPSGTPPPSATMYTGWNLVGPAELHGMLVDEAIVDAYYGTGEANLVGYSRVISPSLNQNQWSFLRDSLPASQECVAEAWEECFEGCMLSADPEFCIRMCMRGYILNPVNECELSVMIPTRGYWVFMVNDGLLGGFTSTPITEQECP